MKAAAEFTKSQAAAGTSWAGGKTEAKGAEMKRITVRAALGRLSALSVFLLKYILYGASVWVRRALKHQKHRFAARAVQKDAEKSFAIFAEFIRDFILGLL